MNGCLFIVSTPIGNLEDITYRAVRVLKEVDLIAVENRSNSRKLLSHYVVNTKLISYNDHNKVVRSRSILKRLKLGMNVALITDAGTPCISDPGYLIVKRCREENIGVIPVPGVSAHIAALSVSGFPTDSYKFAGFFPEKYGKKKEAIECFRRDNITTVYFESPRRLLKTLGNIEELAPDIKIMVAREITKLFEEFLAGTPGEVINKIKSGEFGESVKGEITIIFSREKKSTWALKERAVEEMVLKEIEMLMERSVSTREIASIISKKFSISKKFAYDMALRLKREENTGKAPGLTGGFKSDNH